MNKRILLVEDEEVLCMTLNDRFESEGYVVECVVDGKEGYHMVICDNFDLIILDVMLPQKNGFDVCRDFRKAGNVTFFLMLIVCGQVIDRVLGLKIGADDYLTKPFEMMELMARIEALLRRAPTRSTDQITIHQFGPIRVDLRGTSVSRDGNAVPLSAREFQLLRFFVEHRGTT